MNDPVRLENLGLEHRRAPILSDVCLTVTRGSTYALLGHPGAGKTSLIELLLGRHKPTRGRALLFGEDSWKRRRRLAAKIATGFGGPGPIPELVVVDEPPAGSVPPPGPHTAILATGDPGAVEGVATHAGILKAGRLVLDGPIPDLTSRFRRILYANRLTETRTAYGTELDEFDAVRVRVRGWGVEAIVSNFEPAAFERFRAIDGVDEAQALPMVLAEIFVAVAGDGPAK